MKRFNSTIKQKKCKCSKDCDKYPTLGYKGYNVSHYPGEKKLPNKITIKSSSKIKVDIKSDYLKMADIMFGKWIKKRDADSRGNVTCICCSLTYNIKDKDSSGSNIIQTLHFVPRGVYSLRYSENNCHAGCSMCNLQMHLEPTGLAYKRFKQFLNDALGEDEVNQMELEKRNINKLTESELKTIIDKYKTK